MASKGMIQQVENWVEQAANEQDMVARITDYTEVAESKTGKGAQHQLNALETLEEIATKKGRAINSGAGLDQHIIVQQHHKIRRYGDKAFALSDKQVAAIVRANWRWAKLG